MIVIIDTTASPLASSATVITSMGWMTQHVGRPAGLIAVLMYLVTAACTPHTAAGGQHLMTAPNEPSAEGACKTVFAGLSNVATMYPSLNSLKEAALAYLGTYGFTAAVPLMRLTSDTKSPPFWASVVRVPHTGAGPDSAALSNTLEMHYAESPGTPYKAWVEFAPGTNDEAWYNQTVEDFASRGLHMDVAKAHLGPPGTLFLYMRGVFVDRVQQLSAARGVQMVMYNPPAIDPRFKNYSLDGPVEEGSNALGIQQITRVIMPTDRYTEDMAGLMAILCDPRSQSTGANAASSVWGFPTGPEFELKEQQGPTTPFWMQARVADLGVVQQLLGVGRRTIAEGVAIHGITWLFTE